MNKKLCILFVLFFIFLPCFYYISFSKYSFDYSFCASKIMIDQKPKIEVLSVTNTNTGYEKYANHTHKITLTVKITEKNITTNHFHRDYINVFVGDSKVSSTIGIHLVSSTHEELVYSMSISDLTSNGYLSIYFPEGIIEDSSSQTNTALHFHTNILIDNISPQASGQEISIENNQSKYVIDCDENIRPFGNWDLSNNRSLSKIFSSPIYYPISVTDYAGNETEVFIDIKNATDIMLYYANYNTYRFSKFDSNGQISGKQAIIDSANYKSEMIILHLEGAISQDDLQARVFDYTYWGENTRAVCDYSEIDYFYGYSPSPSSWYDMHSQNVIRCLGKISLQLGGQGHNIANNSCSDTFNPIPKAIADKNLYGLSGIALNLKNSNDYSIIYQVYVPNVGWLKATSDGEESTYSHDKPFSAIRINIVPKSEKQYILKYWNQFIGTNTIF